MEQAVSTVRQKAPRGARGGWGQDEMAQLWEQVEQANVQGEPLRSVFDRVAEMLGRKPNSIRNFYYAQLKARQEPTLKRALPFETFTEDQVKTLLRQVLSACAQGRSVRACVHQLADGDKTLMLRYQNKYRSTIKNRPQLVKTVIADMEAAGESYIDPTRTLRARHQEAGPLLRETVDSVQRLGEPALVQMLEGLNQLLKLAMGSKTRDRTQELDRLNVRYDLARIALDDAMGALSALKEASETQIQCVKEYLGQSELMRASNVGAFCEQIGGLLGALEQAVSAADKVETPQ